MNKLTRNKGITLTALVVTVVLLLILVGVGITIGKNTIEDGRLVSYGIELTTMQSKVNELEQQYKNGDESVLTLGNGLQNTEQENTAFQGAGVSDKTGYRYYNKDTIIELNLQNFKQEFLVNVANRKVISLYGIPHGKDQQGNPRTIWTPEQLDDGTYNVDYSGIPSVTTFDLESGKSQIIVKNIQYTGDVKKGTIYYGQGTPPNNIKWQVAKNDTTDTSCIINVRNEGVWYVIIKDSSGHETDVKEVKVNSTGT